MVAAITPHVIVMDDAQELLPIYEEVLAEGGFRVTLYAEVPENPAEILDLAPDLVILDLLVARQNHGMPFLRQFRASTGGLSVPVIVCSAANDMLRAFDEEIRALDASVLAKPFDIDELLERANASLRGSRVLD
jgi:DNA-binding response OmpR family regulator